MVHEIECDIFKAPIDVLCHCANCFCRMKSGIAKEIVKRFPEAEKIDNYTVVGSKDKLGKISVAKINYPQSQIKFVVNMYGQFKYGTEKRRLNYEAFYRALEETDKEVNPELVLGFPYRIGSDRAGGNWGVIRAMIYSVFYKKERIVYICKHE